MDLVDKGTPRAATPRASVAGGRLSKSIFALAIEPLTMALTVTGRKAYNVMLWIAQRSPSAPDGGYSSPVSAIVRGYGSTTKLSERVQRYIEQMVQTAVVWRPLAATEQMSLPLEGFEAGAPQAATDEARTFPLLAEARLYIRGGEAWVTWYYPPSIREQLISPERWAQIELNSIARLSTYTAVALYEVCARYKDSPGGLTSRHEPDFWTRILREGGGLKPREFRKFKNELLMPAVAEINDVAEIEIELVEHREQGTLRAVQFKVRRKARERERAPDPADVSLVMRAAKLGVRESDLDTLVGRYGAPKVAEGLDAMDSYVNDPGANRINNRAAYLKVVLANRFRDDAVPPPPAAPQAAAAPKSNPAEEREGLVKAWTNSKLRAVHAEFAALSDEEQRQWIDRAKEHRHFAIMTAAMRKRLDEGQWESPLIRQIVLDVFATARYGAGWLKPGEIDLVMFAVAQDRPAAAGAR